jgi:hypothetical protein
VISGLVKESQLRVIAAYFDLKSGGLMFFGLSTYRREPEF